MTNASNVQAVPIVEVAQALAIETRERGGHVWMKCLWSHHEHDDTNPGCRVGGDKNIVHCYKCGISKDTVGLVMQAKGMEARDAYNWIRSEFHLPGPKDKNYKPLDPINQLSWIRDWSLAAFELLGAENRKQDVAFPMRDEKGEIVGFKLRKGNNTTFTFYGKPVKSKTPRGNKHGLFYPKDGITDDGIIIGVEGEADFMAGLTASWHDVVGTAGEGIGRIGEAALQSMFSGRKWVLFPDPGASGRAWLDRMGEILLNAQNEVWYVPASKHDLDGRLHKEKDKRKALKALIEKAKKYIPPDPAKLVDLPAIEINDMLVDSITRLSISALVEKNDPPVIFVRGAKLSKTHVDEDENVMIQTYNRASLRFRLAECARFVMVSQGNHPDSYKKPPDDVVDAILHMGEWPFPPLRGVTSAPILRPDGSICTEPGYDAQSCLVYRPPADLLIPDIPENPSAEDIEKSKKLVLDVICDFPFEDEASRANSLAFMFTLMMRSVIDGYVPLCLVDSPTQGTGKGKLVKNLAHIPLGTELPTQTMPQGRYADEEWRKLLLGILREGSPAVLFDNVSEREIVDSAPLASLMTTGKFGGRILTQPDVQNFRVNLILVATGNNIKVTGDMTRRCYTVRLDANMERPWERHPDGFEHPSLEKYVRDNNVKLLTAAFTLIRAWYAAGCPEAQNIPVMGSFIEWSNTIGSVLEFIGIEGFLKNQEKLRVFQDDEAIQWQAFFEQWFILFGDKHVSTPELCEMIINPETDISKALPDVLLGARDKGLGSLKRSLGRRLSRMTGKIYKGLKLHFSVDAHRHHKQWMLIPEDDQAAKFAKLREVMDSEKTTPTDGTLFDENTQDIVENQDTRSLRGLDGLSHGAEVNSNEKQNMDKGNAMEPKFANSADFPNSPESQDLQSEVNEALTTQGTDEKISSDSDKGKNNFANFANHAEGDFETEEDWEPEFGPGGIE